MSKCRYDLSEDCNNTDCLNCVLDEIMDEVYDIDDKIVLNPDSLFERKSYVRLNTVIDIIDKYKAESEHKCHDCKHYTSGEQDGSCDSYICKGYSGWESDNCN